MTNSTPLCILFGIASTISVTSEIFLIISHLDVPRLLKHPGSLILGQCIGHLVFDLYTYTAIDSLRDYLSDIGLCNPIGWIAVMGLLICWLYVAFIGIEMMLKILNPSKTNYRKRTMLYHTLAWVIGLIYPLVIYFSMDDEDIFTRGNCFIRLRGFGR